MGNNEAVSFKYEVRNTNLKYLNFQTSTVNVTVFFPLKLTKFQMFITSFLNSDMRYLRIVLSKSSPPRYVSPFVAFTCKSADKEKNVFKITLFRLFWSKKNNIHF